MSRHRNNWNTLGRIVRRRVRRSGSWAAAGLAVGLLVLLARAGDPPASGRPAGDPAQPAGRWRKATPGAPATATPGSGLVPVSSGGVSLPPLPPIPQIGTGGAAGVPNSLPPLPGPPVPLAQAPPPGPTVPQVPGTPAPTPPAPTPPPPTTPPSVPLPPPRATPPPSIGLPPPRTIPDTDAGDSSDVPDSVVLLASARNAVRQNDLPLAITRFEQYLRIKGDDVEVREELAGIEFRADRLADATREYERLIRENPRKAATYLITLAAIAVRQQQYAAGEARLTDAIGLTVDESQPGHRRTRLVAASRLAQLFLILGQYPKAVGVGQQYLAGLTADDDDVPPEYVELLLDLEQPEKALAFVGPLLELNPEDATVLTARVRAYAQLGDRAKAYPAIDGLPEVIPDDVDARLKLAQDLVRGQDFDLAELVLQQISGVRPQYPPAQIVQANALVRQYRLGQAKAAIAAIRPNSNYQDRDYALTRAGFHEAAGEYIQAKLVYKTILQSNPFDAPTHLAFGGLYAGMSEYEKAKAEYSKVPPDHPSWRPARRGLAAALVAQRRFPEALDVLDELARCAPGTPTRPPPKCGR